MARLQWGREVATINHAIDSLSMVWFDKRGGDHNSERDTIWLEGGSGETKDSIWANCVAKGAKGRRPQLNSRREIL